MYYLRNLSSTELFNDVLPWDFNDLSLVPEECFKDKAARDAWINNPATDYHVYTLYEGIIQNTRLRAGGAGTDEDNPPLVLHGLAVDYDAPLTFEQVQKALLLMGDNQPSWFESTLSGHGRLLWMFQEPIKFPSRSFCKYFLERIGEFVPIDKLPGLDKPALMSPERYFTNGCKWTRLSAYPVPAATLRGFIMKLSEKFNWRTRELGKVISLESVAAECAKRYPRFAEWPGEFVLGSQGPSFWIDGSESMKSAIVRDTGIHTFSGHASKAFYSWSELVGSEFVENTESTLLGKAVDAIWYDGKNFIFTADDGKYAVENQQNIRLILSEGRGLSNQKVKGASGTQVDKALFYIISRQRVDGAASCAFYPKGIFDYQGKKILNTHQIEALRPAPVVDASKFTFIAQFLNTFFNPVEPQQERFLAWLQYFYRSCLQRQPCSGHGVFIAGPVGVGKTFLNRGIIAGLVGGCAEANAYLTGSDNFNSEIFEHALWVVDDGSVMDGGSIHRLFSENVKRAVANRDHRQNEKFRKAVLTPWQGRVIVTCNDDPESIRIIPNLEVSIREKLMLFRAGEKKVKFLTQPEMEKMLVKELPYFARWLLDWTPPSHCFEGAESRFGLVAYCEPTLAQTANQSSSSSVFGELLTKWLAEYFSDDLKAAPSWSGSATDLRMAMAANPVYAEMLRAYRADAVSRMLVQLSNKKMFRIDIAESKSGRIFTIYREREKQKEISPEITNQNDSKFQAEKYVQV